MSGGICCKPCSTLHQDLQIARQDLEGNRMPATRELDYNISLNT